MATLVKVWASGPTELLEHASDHMLKAGSFDLRIALISVDNAVELMIKTYLGLPKRIRGSDGPSTKDLQQATSSFPNLLDLLEKFAGSRLSGIDLGDVEVYHRLRNTLYHEGNGVTVDPRFVDAYYQIATVMLKNLLGTPLLQHDPASATTSVGALVLKWAVLVDKIRALEASSPITHIVNPNEPVLHTVDRLVGARILHPTFRAKLKRANALRNALVHSVSVPLTEQRIADEITALDDLIVAVPSVMD